jgi:peroxiredoxin
LKLPADADLEVDWSAAELTISHYRSEENTMEDSQPPEYERLVVEPSGRFTVQGLAAGAYTLNAKVALPPLVENGQSRSREGEATASVEVAGSEEQTPLDVGDLTITVRIDLEVGQIAPLFEAPTLDGGTLRLADFCGKYVLLDFWATWCGPCVAQTPDLKEIFEAFGSDERFAMIALSLDHTTKRPADYVKQHDLKWRHAFLGYWSASKVPEDFGVHAIPQVMLLDPSGKVIAKDLRGEAIKRAIEEALK